VLKSFRNKGLSDLWATGTARRIDPRMYKRILVRLDRMDVAEALADLNLPGFNFHALNGFSPARYSIHVNGPWCLTFEFDGVDVSAIDFEQYH
jgi:proteic killer suppression protein